MAILAQNSFFSGGGRKVRGGAYYEEGPVKSDCSSVF